jgi:glutamate/tyrosine decarboxylase-like PLP-dependent enzyme
MDNLLDIPAQANRLAKRHNRLTSAPASAEPPTLPAESTIQAARSSLCSPSSASYLTSQPQEAVASHIAQDIVPALSGQNQSARYLGFVTGGVLPLAEWADNVAARYDQNVQVHLPAQSIATDVEDAALEMLVRLFRFQKPEEWKGRTFTTGATASNVMGLAVGRESVVNKRLEALGFNETVGNVGLLAAAAKAGVSNVQVLASAGHSSLAKAASVVGLGRLGVKDMRASDDQPWKLDLDAVEEALQRPGVVSIIGIGAGEVNTGRYALDGIHEWKRLRNMADHYGAWIHVDGGKWAESM